MRKLFRWHRGGLEESMATVVEVNDFSDIEAIVRKDGASFGKQDYYKNLNTKFAADDSRRLGEEWKETYYVIADFSYWKEQCIGSCNFAKE